MRILTLLFLLLIGPNQSKPGWEAVHGAWRWAYTPEVGMKPTTHSVYRIQSSTNGKLEATFEGGVVMQHRRRMKAVSWSDGTLTITHNRMNMYFKGALQPDLKTIKGRIVHHGSWDSLTLYKVDPITLGK